MWTRRRASTPSGVRSKARRLQLEHGLDVIMIDYLSLMTGVGKFGSRQEEVSSISRSLKAHGHRAGRAHHRACSSSPARPRGVPTIDRCFRTSAIPAPSSRTRTWSCSFTARIITTPKRADKNIAEIIIAKQRNGSLGTVKLGWKGEYTWFMDLSPTANEASGQ